MSVMILDACACGTRHQPRLVCDAIRTEARRDPTRTGRVRQDLARVFEVRWLGLRKLIRQAIVEQDFFGVKQASVASIQLIGHTGGQTQAFQAWIDSALLMTVVGRDNRWLHPWMDRGYRMGIESAARSVGEPLGAPYGRTEHLSAWAFIELQGIAEAVSQQAVRELSEGILNRLRPAAIARNVIARVNAVGALRSRLLAHHAVVKAHATGTLDALEMAGWATVAVIPEALSPTDPGRKRMGGAVRPGKAPFAADARAKGRPRPNAKEQRRIERAQRRLEAMRQVEVLTAGDDDVCVVCENISEDGPYPINRARQLIPAHPNCRCSFVPFGDKRFAKIERDPNVVTEATPAQDLLKKNFTNRESLDAILARELTAEQRKEIARFEAEMAARVRTNATVAEGGYVRPDGTYTPARQALHERILREMFTPEAIAKARPVAGERPVLTMTGGRAGAGKTTSLAKLPDGTVRKNSFFLSSDEIQEKLPGYNGHWAGLFNGEAQDIALKAEAYAKRMGLNLTYDATMKSADGAIARVNEFKAAGYGVEGYFVHTTPDTSAVRSVRRAFGETGRYVPPRFPFNSLTNEETFDRLIPDFDKWALIDNNGREPKVIATGGKSNR